MDKRANESSQHVLIHCDFSIQIDNGPNLVDDDGHVAHEPFETSLGGDVNLHGLMCEACDDEGAGRPDMVPVPLKRTHHSTAKRPALLCNTHAKVHLLVLAVIVTSRKINAWTRTGAHLVYLI